MSKVNRRHRQMAMLTLRNDLTKNS